MTRRAASGVVVGRRVPVERLEDWIPRRAGRLAERVPTVSTAGLSERHLPGDQGLQPGPLGDAGRRQRPVQRERTRPGQVQRQDHGDAVSAGAAYRLESQRARFVSFTSSGRPGALVGRSPVPVEASASRPTPGPAGATPDAWRGAPAQCQRRSQTHLEGQQCHTHEAESANERDSIPRWRRHSLRCASQRPRTIFGDPAAAASPRATAASWLARARSRRSSRAGSSRTFCAYFGPRAMI
jgi:hypothetical protein